MAIWLIRLKLHEIVLYRGPPFHYISVIFSAQIPLQLFYDCISILSLAHTHHTQSNPMEFYHLKKSSTALFQRYFQI